MVIFLMIGLLLLCLVAAFAAVAVAGVLYKRWLTFSLRLFAFLLGATCGFLVSSGVVHGVAEIVYQRWEGILLVPLAGAVGGVLSGVGIPLLGRRSAKQPT